MDLEVIAPDGRRAHTGTPPAEAERIPESHGGVDCAGFGAARASNRACTASVEVRNPAFGTWRVIATTSDSAYRETLTVGWGGPAFRKSGGFGVRVFAAPRRPAEFAIIVAPEGVTERAQRGPAPQ